MTRKLPAVPLGIERQNGGDQLLASKGVNSIYLVLNNISGDRNDT
jgi:hypothetical protein